MARRRPFLDSAREVVVIDAVRTPIGRAHPERGYYRDTHPNALLGACFAALLERSGVCADRVDDVIVGCAQQFGEQQRNIARNAWLQAGLPPEVPATTLDRRCGSGQTAVTMAAALVASGTCELAIAGGVEHMQRVPTDAMQRVEDLLGTPWPAELWARYDFVHQGVSAELIAERWGISREEMDALAVESHRRAARAAAEARFEREFVAVDTPHRAPTRDQGIREGIDAEQLATLKTPFKADGRITAATSSQISDGAAAVLLASRARAEELGLVPRARVFDQVTVGVDPVIMLTGPIPATRLLLERNGLAIGDIDRFEVNEAFAAVVAAWERELAPDHERVNVNGGAMALGHPVGASGARLIATLVSELERCDGELGLATMCCGGGLGTGTLLQRINETTGGTQ